MKFLSKLIKKISVRAGDTSDDTASQEPLHSETADRYESNQTPVSPLSSHSPAIGPVTTAAVIIAAAVFDYLYFSGKLPVLVDDELARNILMTINGLALYVLTGVSVSNIVKKKVSAPGKGSRLVRIVLTALRVLGF